ncbi:MAG: helix-turn-helix domain-containing protein, partial [Saprospiraceae bacterium]
DDDMFGVEQLAASVNMSRSNLFRKLDALTGKSPNVIIRELRLARGKDLLEQGAGNTTEVSFMVGFNTPAYFVKCFTDEYGMPPGEVRKRMSAAKASGASSQ